MDDMASVGLKVDSRDVRTASGDLDRFAGAGDRAGGSAGRAQGAFAGMARGLAVAAGAAAAAAAAVLSLGTATRQALEFGSALSEVGTLIKGTAKQTAFLDDASKRLAATYGGTGTAQAKAFYQAISAGAGSVEEAAETLDAANRLAIGGVTDVTTAVGILSTAMNVYEASNLSAADASDAIFVAVKAGVTTVGELSSALGKVLPLAEKMGLTFDETAAATAALTKGGLSTAEAVTGLRASLAAVLGPTTQAADMAKELGLDFSAAAIEAQGFAGFMADVVAKTGGSAEKMQTLFGSVEAVGAALAFSGSAGESMAAILDDMAVKTGATSEAFNKMSEDMQQRLNVVMGELWGLTTSFGSALLTVLVPALEGAAGVMTLIAENADALAIAFGVLATTQIPAVVGGLVTMSAWLATSEGLFIAGAIAARGMSIAMNLIPGVALFTGLTVALTGIYRGFNDSNVAAAGFSAALGDVETAQTDLETVTERYYRNMTRENLQALRDQAALVVSINETALAKAEAELAAASFYTNFFGASLYETERMATAKAAINELKGGIIEAEARLDAASVAAENMGDSIDGAGSSTEAAAAATARWEATMIGVKSQLSAIGSLIAQLGGGAISAVAKQTEITALRAGASIKDAAVAASEYRENLELAAKKMELNAKFGETIGGVMGKALDAAVNYNRTLDKTLETERGITTEAEAAAAAGDSIAKGMKDAEKAASKLADQIERLEFDADPLKKYNAELADLNEIMATGGLSDGAYDKAVQKLNDGLADQLPMVNDLASAFADFVVRGFSDFKGFVRSVLDSFKSMLAQMTSMAVQNKIIIPIMTAFTGGGAGQAMAGAAGQAAGGGGGLLGGLGGIAASFGSGAAGLVTSLTGAGGGFAAAGTYLSAVTTGATASMGAFAAAAGAVAVPLLAVAGIFSFFKKKTKELDAGIMATVDGLDTLVQTFRVIQTKRFGGLSKKVRTHINDADEETTDAITNIVDALQGGVLASADALGIAASTFDNFAHTMRISTRGLSEEAANKAIQDALMGMVDAMAGMVDGLSAFALNGEGASATLERLANSLVAVNDGFDILGKSIYSASLSGADLASTMIDAFGGLDAMTQAVGAYWQGFYTEEERLATSTRRLTEAMAGLGFALPDSRDGFRALVEGIDTSTHEGAALYAGLLNLSGAFSEITAATENIANAVGDMVKSILGDLELMPTSRAQNAARNALQINETRAMQAAAGGDTAAVQKYLTEIRAASSSDVAYREVAARVLATLTGGVAMPDPSVTGAPTFAAAQNRPYAAPGSSAIPPGADVTAQLRLVATELAAMREENRQLGLRADRHRKTTADTLEKWEIIGLPQERTT